MPPKEFHARRLDVQAFAEDGGQLAGRAALADLPRLQAEAQGPTADRGVSWSARGELRNPRHVQPQPWLYLQAQTVLPLTCQRCLAPVDVPVAVDRAFRFVADEAQAAAQDDAAEEDVLALARDFDLWSLVEDEILMDLPLVPRHEICPEDLPAGAAGPADEAESVRPHPFAVLQSLRSRPPGEGR